MVRVRKVRFWWSSPIIGRPFILCQSRCRRAVPAGLQRSSFAASQHVSACGQWPGVHPAELKNWQTEMPQYFRFQIISRANVTLERGRHHPYRSLMWKSLLCMLVFTLAASGEVITET